MMIEVQRIDKYILNQKNTQEAFFSPFFLVESLFKKYIIE